MDILYYLAVFPKISESFVLNELYELDAAGHDVAVFALRDSGEDITHHEFEQLDIPVRYAEQPTATDALDLLSTTTLHPRVMRRVPPEKDLRYNALSLHRHRQCVQFLRDVDMDVDVVHTHFAIAATYPARYVAAYLDVPVTVTTHAHDLFRDPDETFLRRQFESADHVVTISEYNREHIRTALTDETPVSVVHAGIRPAKFEPRSATVDGRLLTVARLAPKKGITYALEALAQVVTDHPDVEYHLIGAGPLESELERRVSELGLEDNVELLGRVDDDRLIEEFDEAAGFLLPSVVDESGDRDGIPVVLMEAMAMTVPPISTTVSGIPELVDHEVNGLLVEPRNVDQLATAIERLLTRNDERAAFGTAGREKVMQEFNAEAEAKKLEAIFERLA
jgi:glycosyltransferase involved in cell wall biosynthesis